MKKGQLEFNSHFLDHLILNSIINSDFLSKIRNLVDLRVFKSKERKTLMGVIYDYFDEYKEAPKDHFYDIVEEQKENWNESVADRCDKLVNVLLDINESNPEYLLRNVRKGLAHFRMEEAIIQAATLVKGKKYDDAKQIIMEAFREPDGKSNYYNFLTDKSFMERRLLGKTYKMKTMHPEIDSIIGGFNNWLITILGATKGGKTKWMMELAVAGAQQGLNGLFVSLEMNRDEIEDGLDQAIGFLGSKPGQQIEVKERKRNDWVTVKKIVPTIFDLDLVEQNRRALKKQGGNIWIVDESANKFNYKDLIALLDQMEVQDGLIFDFVVVDYLGEMGPTQKNQKKKEKVADNAEGLKQIAKERCLIMITAQQGNRSAMRAKVFHADLISDAIEPVFISDLVLAICQTVKEEAEGIYRMYVALYRHGPKGAFIPLVRDLNVGAISLGGATERQLERAKDDGDEAANSEDEDY